MVMESPIWSFMVCMILCGLVRFSIVYNANVFSCKVSNGLVWLYMVLYGRTQLCTIFVLVTQCLKTSISNVLGHVYPMFAVMFAQGLKTCSMFTPYLEAQWVKKQLDFV